MSRQEAFERHYAEQHDVPVESMAQYRWAEKDGYRLPGISAAYRNYCAGWDQAKQEPPAITPTKPFATTRYVTYSKEEFEKMTVKDGVVYK